MNTPASFELPEEGWWKSCIAPEEHDAFQEGIDELKQQLATRMQELRAYDSLVNSLTLLRNTLSFKEVLAIAKRIGQRNIDKLGKTQKT